MKISSHARGILGALSAAVVAANAEPYPLQYSNCGYNFTVDDAPERAVTLNQGTTEMMLGLGLQDRMVGTAYLDDAIWPEFAAAYETVPVLAALTYPTIDKLREANPDFLYASYRSAFQARTEDSPQNRIDYFDWLTDGCAFEMEDTRGNATYCRPELDSVLGIQSYLQTPYCERKEYRPDSLSLEDLYQEIDDIATIFGVPENAASLRQTIEGHFESAEALVQANTNGGGDNSALRVLFLDSWDDTTPLVGACCGSINSIIEYAGAENIFKDLGTEEKKTWADANWTDIVEEDPDVIIVVDASWDLAGASVIALFIMRVLRCCCSAFVASVDGLTNPFVVSFVSFLPACLVSFFIVQKQQTKSSFISATTKSRATFVPCKIAAL